MRGTASWHKLLLAPVHPRLSLTYTNRPTRHATSYPAGSLEASTLPRFLPLRRGHCMTAFFDHLFHSAIHPLAWPGKWQHLPAMNEYGHDI